MIIRLFFCCLFLVHGLVSFEQCLTPDSINNLINTANEVVLENLLQDSTKCPYTDTIKGDLLHRIGILHYLQYDKEAAIRATQLALGYRQISVPKSLKHGKSHHNLGVFNKELFQYDEAVFHFYSAVEIYQQLGITRKTIDSSRELAACYGAIGEYGLARQYIEKAINLAKDHKEEILLSECYVDYGKLLLQQEEWEEAILILSQADTLFLGFYPTTDEYIIGSHSGCLHNLAFAWDALADFQQALNYQQRSLLLANRINEPISIVRSLINLGVSNRKINKHTQALNYYHNAINRLTITPNSALLAIVHDNMGDVYYDKGKYKEALANYQNAIHTLIPAVEQNDPTSNPTTEQLSAIVHPIDLLTYLSDKAKVWFAEYELKKNDKYLQLALDCYLLADKVHDVMRLQQLSDHARQYWRAEAKQLYDKALSITFLLQDEETAFYFFEKSKSILLLEALLVKEARHFLPKTMVEEEQRLQWLINDLIVQKENNNSTIANELLTTQESYRDLLQQMQQKHPSYYHMRYANDMQTYAAAIKNLSRVNQYLVHYFVGEKYIYLLRLNSQGALFKRIHRDEKKEEQVKYFLRFFNERSSIASNPDAFIQSSQIVCEYLYNPIWEEGLIQDEAEVIIMPDDFISLIPFDALIDRNDIANSSTTFPTLIYRQQFRYAYSSTVLQYQRKRAKTMTQTGRISFFAPFTQPSEDFASLSYSQEVLKMAKRKFKGDYHSGDRAKFSAFHSCLPEARLIHFSTHASTGNGSTTPFIALADTLVYLPTLYGLPLSAQLVILSACETGLGTILAGEGVINLARGFAYNGSSSLITSLWKADDKATAFIMKSFYKHLADDRSPAKALYAAKMDYLKQSDIRTIETSPYLWGSLSFWGDDTKVVLTKTHYRWEWLIIALGLLLSFGLIFKLKALT